MKYIMCYVWLVAIALMIAIAWDSGQWFGFLIGVFCVGLGVLVDMEYAMNRYGSTEARNDD